MHAIFHSEFSNAQGEGREKRGVWKEKAEQIKLTGPRESLLHEQLAVLVGFLSEGQKKKKKTTHLFTEFPQAL